MSKYATVDPTTGTMLNKYPTISDAEADLSLTRAAKAYRTWRNVEIVYRAELLARVAELHREHATELAELMTLEMGKPVSQARGEVALAASIYEYYATAGPEMLEEEVIDFTGEGRAVVRTAAIGPLLGIMPWNFPYYQVSRFAAPNILLGNTILLKHASNCPQQALRIAEIFDAAGAPTAVYQNMFVTPDQIASLIRDPQLQGVSLTGSERAGSAVGAVSGQHLKKCVLELGGSDPFIVLPSADLDRAVDAALTGRFSNAGQACTSSKRLIIVESVWDAFVESFTAKAKEWRTGDPMKEETRLGPMASIGTRDDLVDQVRDAITKGAKVHLGGYVPEGSGAYYPATVLSEVTPQMRAYHEELFGPVAVLHKVASIDAAIELANDSPFGLGSAVFTTDDAEADYVANRLDVGMVGINTTVRSAPELPFGGVKTSGIGRELGRFGLDEFSNKKLVRTL